jgi:hypothetical protein
MRPEKSGTKITRRTLAALAAPAAASVFAAPGGKAQTPAASADPLEAAKARIKANTETLAKAAVPMELEPAFQFKA